MLNGRLDDYNRYSGTILCASRGSINKMEWISSLQRNALQGKAKSNTRNDHLCASSLRGTVLSHGIVR